MNAGDIMVFGLGGPTTLLEDIGMEVPHGHYVTIPAGKAHVSKDLWRAISQKYVFQLHPGPNGNFPVSPRPVDTSETEALRAQVKALTEETARLRAILLTKEQEQQTKLDDILAILRVGGVVGSHVTSSSETSHERVVSAGVVSGEVPTFIPSQIKPEGVEVQISTTSEESTGAGVNTATTTLRKLRKSGAQ
jgi:hypothetical protein